MSLPRTGTLEKGVTQPNHMNNEEPPSPLPSHLQHSGSVTSVPGSPTGTSVVVVPPPYSVTGSVAGGTDAPLELRGSLDCWACSVLVTAQNLIIALVNGVLASIVFSTILTPALVMVVFGFLCHSTVQPNGTSLYCSDLLDDGGCVALLVVGFILVTPLLVLALAAYCRLARHLQLGLCFIPYSRAVYKNLPASHHRRGVCCGQPGASEREGKGSVWV
ncbi:transmembrane protein 88a [Esox lucius]|uniref:Transmembrane protein 88 a n=1 Tax=Esox lucius TaxID=8010 RepID=A0AAY5L5S8_ESOLU|nr:transmembrane protein 88a [Esox lucius]XP_010892940.2 transmembrane protein 88a [Esox lucius]XP_019903341.2 transmembrane protein 88a [Esox lucius]